MGVRKRRKTPIIGIDEFHIIQDAWDIWEDTILNSSAFQEYMLDKFYEGYKHDKPHELRFLYRGEADRTWAEQYAWRIMYPNSRHNEAPQGFPEDFIQEKFDRLEEKYWEVHSIDKLLQEIETKYFH